MIPEPPPSPPTYELSQPQPTNAYGAINAPLPLAPTAVETRPRLGLVIPGAIMFGVSYLTTATIAALVLEVGEERAGVLLVPVAGPVICVGTCGAPEGTSTFLIVDGLIQAAGLALLVIGLADQQEVPLAQALQQNPLRWTF